MKTSYTCFCSSIYLFTVSRETAPTELIKQLLVHRVGILVFNFGYSSRRICDVRPLSFLMHSAIPGSGAQSINRWTWSGMTSMSITSKSYMSAVSFIRTLSRSSMPSVKTFRLYFGQKRGTGNYKFYDFCFYIFYQGMEDSFHLSFRSD